MVKQPAKSLGELVSPVVIEGQQWDLFWSIGGKRERQLGERRINHIEEWEGERGSA